MEDLINFVSQKSNLPLTTAEEVAATTLDYLEPHCSQLLKSTIEVMLNYPDLSEAKQDLLIATRVLFPNKFSRPNEPPLFND